jgi:hypothetical protein
MITFLLKYSNHILITISLIYIILFLYSIVKIIFYKNLLKKIKKIINKELILILIFAFLIRFFLFNPIDYQIEGHGENILNQYNQGLNLITSENLEKISPFQLSFFGLFGEIFELNNIFMIHLMNILSIITIFLIYLITIISFKNIKIGLISSFLYSLNPIHIFYSNDTYLTTMPLFFLVFFFIIFLYSIKQNSVELFNISLISYIICIYLRFEYIVLLSPIILFGIILFKKYNFLYKKIYFKLFTIFIVLTRLLITLFTIKDSNLLSIEFLIVNFNFLDMLMPFNSSIYIFLFFIILFNKLIIKNKQISIYLFSIFIFYLFYLFFNDMGPRHIMFPIFLITIIFSVFIYTNLNKNKIIHTFISIIIFLLIFYSSITHLIDLKNNSFLNIEEYNSNINSIYPNLTFINSSYNKNCIFEKIDTNISLFLINSIDEFSKCNSKHSSTMGVNYFLFNKNYLNNYNNSNLYYIYGYNSHVLIANSVYFRIKKLFNMYDLIPITKFFWKDRYFIILKLDKKHR